MNVPRAIWAAWKRIGQFIGDFIARVVLSLFYFTLFVPFGVGVRLFGDPPSTGSVQGSRSSPISPSRPKAGLKMRDKN